MIQPVLSPKEISVFWLLIPLFVLFAGCLTENQAEETKHAEDKKEYEVIPFKKSTKTTCLDSSCANFRNRHILTDTYDQYYEWECCDSVNNKMLFHIAGKTIWPDTLFGEKFEADQMQFGTDFYLFDSPTTDLILLDFFWRGGSVAPQARYLLVASVGYNHVHVEGIKTFNAAYTESSDASNCFYLQGNKLVVLKIGFPENVKSLPWKQDTTRIEFILPRR